MFNFNDGIKTTYDRAAEKLTESGIGSRFAAVSSAPRAVWDKTFDVGSAPEVAGMG